jgi:ribosomal protein S18 acetylase RimI-like enzyme
LAPPEGYTIQQLQNPSDELLTERAASENQVFDRTITTAFLRRLQDAPIYRPELDLVMLAPDGTVAAFCTAWFDARHRIGICEPIGTLAAHRQRGLAKALMYEGFRRLRTLGATTVSLGHSTSNVAGARLYESVGMSVFDQESLWQKDF